MVFWSASFILLDDEISDFKIASSIPCIDIRLFVLIFFTGLSVGKMSFDQLEER